MFATPNHMCLQHRNSISATSKINVSNIEKFISNFETFAWDTCNISRRQMQHVYNNLQTQTRNDYIMKTNDCHRSRILLQHQYTTIATSKKQCSEGRNALLREFVAGGAIAAAPHECATRHPAVEGVGLLR
jgi:hypothetical protein